MRPDSTLKLLFAVSLLAGLTLAGCGQSGPTRYEITGNVTLDGQPVDGGEVLFIPTDGAGSPDACPIAAGVFKGQVTPGSKRVEINATKDTGKVAPDGLPDYQNFIPKQYNTESTLTAEIKGADTAPLNFALESSTK
ncbi:MAG: hypothetical protein ACYC6Y_26980 [Thermoguttaceae bacterium]